jgi:D-alanine-D-alanine ligase
MNIAVVMGGYSGEAEISLKSGKFIISHLDKNKYQVFGVVILKDKWYAFDEQSEYNINKGDFSIEHPSKNIKFDVILNTIHGTPGEDGQLQAYWNLLEIPFSGCGFYQSALTFNKKDTLAVLAKYVIPMAKSYYLKKGESINYNEIESTLQLPFMVKPNQSGSSLGVSKVNKKEDFELAIQIAFKEDDQILMESFLKGTEVSVGVLNFNGKIEVLGITEIVSENDFFDYEAKYLGKSKEITPARISENAKNQVEFLTKKVYQSLGMNGFARVDFIIVDELPHFIEINTNPGLSPASIFPQQVEYAKLNFVDLLESEIKRVTN